MTNTYYNHKQYLSFIIEKYNNSLKNYNIKLKDELPDTCLSLYESMNVYPIYPRPIIMPLKKSDEQYDIELRPNTNLKCDTSQMLSHVKILNKKLIEFDEFTSGIDYKNHVEGKMRRFFDYEIRDDIRLKLNTPNISNAWIKMYELLNTYNLLNTTEQTINTFHICEHPGGFIHAIKYYITNQLNKKHDFVFQSLKPGKDPQIFRADKELLSKYGDKLDYGPKNGDITNSENILYYQNKYKDRYFNLITSDCGLDFSENFVVQESGLYRIFFGAFITAISVSSVGSNYIFKMFSFNDPKTIEFLQLVCLYYERVDLVRTLTTKSGSGENYIVCINHNGKKDIELLVSYLNEKNNNKFLLNSIDEKFMKRIIIHHQLITMRRIISLNSLIFRFINYEFTAKRPEILLYVKNLANYYTNYFAIYIKITSNEKLEIKF